MKSLVGLVSNGGAVVNVWQRVPFIVRAPVVFGLVLLAGAELTRDLNIGVRSGRVAEGQAVEADAKIADPNQTRAAVAAGKPVSGAERTIAAQVAGLDADAQQKQAVADAATESEDELLAKAKRGAKLTSTEKLRLRELQIKAQELAIKQAENTSKTAEASVADLRAAWLREILSGGGDSVIEAGKREAERTTPYLGSGGRAGVSKFTQRAYDKAMNAITGARP